MKKKVLDALKAIGMVDAIYVSVISLALAFIPVMRAIDIPFLVGCILLGDVLAFVIGVFL